TCAACDIIITLVLCFLLNEARSNSRRTNTIVDKLILYAINRGAATSTAALVQLILASLLQNREHSYSVI
ncbi:hypothetical protein MPER_00294, partial [Moniliophthora perniciosa FA553]